MSTTYTVPTGIGVAIDDETGVNVSIGTQYVDGAELTADQIADGGVFGIDLTFSVDNGGGASGSNSPEGESQWTFRGAGLGELTLSGMSVAEVRHVAEVLRTGWSGHAASSIEPPFRHDEDQVVLAIGLVGDEDADPTTAMRRVAAYNNYDQVTLSVDYALSADDARLVADELDKFAAAVEPIEQAISAAA
jgi:hypothetical protein